MRQIKRYLFLLLCCAVLATGVHAQARKTKIAKKNTPPAPAVVEKKAEAAPIGDPVVTSKRNERPVSKDGPAEQRPPLAQTAGVWYRYEFTQPDFVNRRIVIEHGDDGRGTLAFWRRSAGDDAISDPLTLSPTVMERLEAAYAALDFLNSTESYQAPKDFSHLGVVRITMTNGERSRSVTYNWTLNKDAKTLADEYRKISNQHIWLFDIATARDNQPLESPSLMTSLESMIRRGEIADPEQLTADLRRLNDDERLPLIARNHAARIVAQIEKAKKK